MTRIKKWSDKLEEISEVAIFAILLSLALTAKKLPMTPLCWRLERAESLCCCCMIRNGVDAVSIVAAAGACAGAGAEAAAAVVWWVGLLLCTL